MTILTDAINHFKNELESLPDISKETASILPDALHITDADFELLCDYYNHEFFNSEPHLKLAEFSSPLLIEFAQRHRLIITLLIISTLLRSNRNALSTIMPISEYLFTLFFKENFAPINNDSRYRNNFNSTDKDNFLFLKEFIFSKIVKVPPLPHLLTSASNYCHAVKPNVDILLQIIIFLNDLSLYYAKDTQYLYEALTSVKPNCLENILITFQQLAQLGFNTKHNIDLYYAAACYPGYASELRMTYAIQQVLKTNSASAQEIQSFISQVQLESASPEQLALLEIVCQLNNDNALSYGPLNKTTTTKALEILLENMAGLSSTEYQNIIISENELNDCYFTLPNQTPINVNILLRNADLTHLTLNDDTIIKLATLLGIKNASNITEIFNSLLYQYTRNNIYEHLNRIFRDECITAEDNPYVKQYLLIGCLISIFINRKMANGISSHDTTTLTRVDALNTEIYDERVATERERLTALTSTSASNSYASVMKGSGVQVITKISVPTDLYPNISGHADKPFEDEVIIPPGTQVDYKLSSVAPPAISTFTAKIVSSPKLQKDEYIIEKALTDAFNKCENFDIYATYRKMLYIELIIDYFCLYGNENTKNLYKDISAKELLTLKLAIINQKNSHNKAFNLLLDFAQALDANEMTLNNFEQYITKSGAQNFALSALKKYASTLNEKHNLKELTKAPDTFFFAGKPMKIIKDKISLARLRKVSAAVVKPVLSLIPDNHHADEEKFIEEIPCDIDDNETIIKSALSYAYNKHYKFSYPSGLSRKNHDILHAFRKTLYLDHIITYLKEHGYDHIKEKCHALTEDDINWLKIALIFSVTGRESEMSIQENKAEYLRYKKNSARNFFAYLKSENVKLPETWQGQQTIPEDLATDIESISDPDFKFDFFVMLLSFAHELDNRRTTTDTIYDAAIDKFDMFNISVDNTSEQDKKELKDYARRLYDKHCQINLRTASNTFFKQENAPVSLDVIITASDAVMTPI